MKTTLNKIRDYHPCKEGWEKLLKSLNKTKADDEPIDIRYIIRSNGIEDAVWCLRAIDDQDKVDLFKRRVALINIALIKPYTNKYDLIVQYLETGDESIREEVKKATSAAARAADEVVRAASYAAAYVAASAATEVTAWEQIEEILLEIIEEGEK